MVIPRKDFSGEKLTVTVMEFRREPGEVLERVRYGATVEITKNGKHIASLVPAPTVIHADGSWTGERPLTMAHRP